MSEKRLRKALKHDFWMNMEMALEYGLVDEVKV